MKTTNIDEKITKTPIVIFCGGNGIHLENAKHVPKAAIKIASSPMVCHVIKSYVDAGFENFYLAGGLNFEQVKTSIQETWKKYEPIGNDSYSFNVSNKAVCVHFLNTGKTSPTGERLHQTLKIIPNSEYLGVTYSDTVSTLDIKKYYDWFLNSEQTQASLIAVKVPTRFRVLGLVPNQPHVRGFSDKTFIHTHLINGGYYFFSRNCPTLKNLQNTVLETDILEKLVSEKSLLAYPYIGEWQCLDSERDFKPLAAIAEIISTGSYQ